MRISIGLVAALALVVLGSPPAGAAVTHQYLGQITLASGTDPQPAGIDDAGNIIVFLDGEEVIAKFDDSGNPVNFSALGTNVIDGKGGLECPKVPTDCDRVPAGKLGPFVAEEFRDNMVVVDQSGGPADGYIYIANHNAETVTGEVAVFRPSGEFAGTINETQATPVSQANVPVSGIAIGPDGSVLVSRATQAPPGDSEMKGGFVDRYVPVSGDPSEMLFAGQLRFAFQVPSNPQANQLPEMMINAGPNGAFIRGPNPGAPDSDLGYWRWFAQSAFGDQEHDYSIAKDYLPFGAFNNGGENGTGAYQYGAVNPNDDNIQLFTGGGVGMAIFDESAEKLAGPTIGHSATEIAGSARTIAFDNSGGPKDGYFYLQGDSDKLSVFSPPVTVPDIEVGPADQDHKELTLHAEVTPAGDPSPVSACQLEFGTSAGSYPTVKPCGPATPYGGATQVSATVDSLVPETVYHYRFRVTNANGDNVSTDHAVRTVAVLGVQTGTPTDVAPTSAKLNGVLDPDGMETTYKFEYGTSTVYDLETTETSAGAGSGSVDISPVAIGNLQPGRTYHYRLVATNELGTTVGEDRAFTAPARPLISGLNPTDVTATSAILNARINSYDSQTSYYFRYGPTGAYGQTTPVEQLGPDTTVQPISAQISGLEANVGYHFRLVATNEHGTSESADGTFDFQAPACPNSHVRQQVGANYLPDCRAYELVSPGRAGSVQLFPGDLLATLEPGQRYTAPNLRPHYRNTGLATSPTRFGFFGGLGGMKGLESPNFVFDHFIATRTNAGWNTSFAGLPSSVTAISFRGECSATFSKCIDYNVDFINPQNPFGVKAFPYVWDPDGNFLERWPTNFEVVPGADHLTGDEEPSGDFSHYVFSSLDVAFAPGGLEQAPGSVYDNAVGPKTVTIASRLSDGTPIPQGGAGGAKEFLRVPAVSMDGSRILMSTAEAGATTILYMRVNGAVTYDVSRGAGVSLIGVSRDASKVAFVTDLQLTPNDEDLGSDIYLWSQQGDQLRLVSQGNGNGNDDDCHANFVARCGAIPVSTQRPDIDDRMSADGDVYFYSPEQLDPANPGVRNQRNLYHLRDDGTAQYVTTFDLGTEADRLQISADGQHAAFLTRAPLTGYNSTYADNFGSERVASQMYVFDATSGEVQCASCNPTGAPPSILRSDPPGNESGTTSADVMASKNGPFMSDDGRVAFSTADALVPRDTNGKIDVYEYVDGRPQMITSGTTERDVFPKLALIFNGQNTGLELISRDGTDLYFSTYETLVPEDENGPFVKFYDARTGGGFPIQGELLPCEAADECHGTTSSAGAEPQIGTGTPYSEPGNVSKAKKKSAKKKASKKKRKARKRRHKERHGRGARR